ncbi:hypothetical protein [Asticcacaulis sp. AND118]|uniref:hypothetical protein n=1 Tax=Asticcacaulis sp. AND118 TaxID=2840468 RepID=UPI001CFFC126|nr:hypothetical protein [Asticcacaulis sp. AND118]UDF02538.1 hypothetical protein LH365_08815 [Asticcacaulis sp. AND118]
MPGGISGPHGLRRAIKTRVDGVFKGGGRQRLAIAGLLSGLPLLALWSVTQSHLIMALILNVIFLGVLITLCWKSPHPWPVVAGGFQWMSAMLPVVALSDPRIGEAASEIALTVTTAAVFVALVWGAFATLRKNRIKFIK